MSCACLQSHRSFFFFFFRKLCVCEDNNLVKPFFCCSNHDYLIALTVSSNYQNCILFVKLWVKANWMKSALKPNLSLFAPFAFFFSLLSSEEQSSADSAQLVFLASRMLTQVFVLKQIAALPPLGSLSFFLPLCLRLHFLLFLMCSLTLFAVILLWLLWVPNRLCMSLCVCVCMCKRACESMQSLRGCNEMHQYVMVNLDNRLAITCWSQRVWICVGATNCPYFLHKYARGRATCWLHSITMAEMSFLTQGNLSS